MVEAYTTSGIPTAIHRNVHRLSGDALAVVAHAAAGANAGVGQLNRRADVRRFHRCERIHHNHGGWLHALRKPQRQLRRLHAL